MEFMTNKNPAGAGLNNIMKDFLGINCHFDCVSSFRPFLYFKGHTLAFIQRAKAFGFNCRVVHKDIFSSPFRFNKSKPLGFIKPFNGTFTHLKLPPRNIRIIFKNAANSRMKGINGRNTMETSDTINKATNCINRNIDQSVGK
jgi:hypothetical protein